MTDREKRQRRKWDEDMREIASSQDVLNAIILAVAVLTACILLGCWCAG